MPVFSEPGSLRHENSTVQFNRVLQLPWIRSLDWIGLGTWGVFTSPMGPYSDGTLGTGGELYEMKLKRSEKSLG